LCKKKLKDLPPANSRSVDWYKSEIARLEEHLILLQVVREVSVGSSLLQLLFNLLKMLCFASQNPPKLAAAVEAARETELEAKGKLKEATSNYVKAKNALASPVVPT